MGECSLKTFELREVSRCIEIFYYKNDIFQNKINDLATTAIFLLYKKMLSGHKKVKNGAKEKVSIQNKMQTMQQYNTKATTTTTTTKR